MSAELSTFDESLVTASRSALGDTLRSVTRFTPDEFELLYLRRDLQNGPAGTHEIKAWLVDNERLGFSSQESYNRLAEMPEAEPQIGEYEFTIRVFSEGFIGRVIVGETGVLLTTDAMDVDAFEELAVTLRRILADAPGAS